MKNIYDLIIIGGGPAGITAGIYSARKKLKTLLVTKDFMGQVGKTGAVENYPGFSSIIGMELMKRLEEHLKKFEVEIQEGEEVTKVKKAESKFLVKTETGKEFLGKSVIVATGRDPRPLEVPGEKGFIGRGVSYCSVCDSPFFKDKSVAVIGGGNAGFEAALDLAKYAKRIFIFERGEKVLADEILQERVKKEKKIEIHLNKDIKKIEGRGKVQDIVYLDLKTKRTFQMPIHGVFVQIGSVPATGFLKGLVDPVRDKMSKASVQPSAGISNGVEFNEWDEIKVEFETCATSMPGIFAAGDVNDGRWKQIVIAAGEGCRAALAAYEYLQKKEL